MEHGDYPLRLQEHLRTHYRPETEEFIARACKVGRVSEQFALELLETVELDRVTTDAEMVTDLHPETSWDGDMLAARRAQHRRNSVDL